MTIQVWTWDAGTRDVDLADRALAIQVLQTVLEGGLWKELRKFPVEAIAAALPALRIPAHTRRLLELWIEEASSAGSARGSARVAGRRRRAGREVAARR